MCSPAELPSARIDTNETPRVRTIPTGFEEPRKEQME